VRFPARAPLLFGKEMHQRSNFRPWFNRFTIDPKMLIQRQENEAAPEA
jgi:hypothetical protein